MKSIKEKDMMNILHLIEVKFGREKSEPEPIDLNMLKLNVVQGNEYEINKTKDELEKLKSDLESFPKLYCKKNGHSYVVFDYSRIGETGWHSFAGDEVIYSVSYKCSVCGKQYYSVHPLRSPEIEYKGCKLPDSAYDDKNLQIDGRTYRMVEEEISRLEDYLAYRQYLKKKICELAGHTMKRSNNYICVCCGKTMSYSDYRNYLECSPITLTRDTFLSLPTFEDYLNEIKTSEEEASLNNCFQESYTKRMKYFNRNDVYNEMF